MAALLECKEEVSQRAKDPMNVIQKVSLTWLWDRRIRWGHHRRKTWQCDCLQSHVSLGQYDQHNITSNWRTNVTMCIAGYDQCLFGQTSGVHTYLVKHFFPVRNMINWEIHCRRQCRKIVFGGCRRSKCFLHIGQVLTKFYACHQTGGASLVWFGNGVGLGVVRK